MSPLKWLTGKHDSTELKELTEQVKSTKTLVDLAWNIGKAVVGAAYDKHQADQACAGYRERYEQRHARVKILGMSEPVELESIYTEVRIVPPDSLRGYRSHEELQANFLETGRSLASHDFDRYRPQPGLKVVNDEKNRFLNVLGAPGAGKTTFLRYIGLKALQGYCPSTTGQVLRDAGAVPYRFNLLPVLLELRNLRNTTTDLATLIDEELQVNGFPASFGRAALRAGGLLVLLDGLDEVPAEKLDATLQSIRDLVDQHSRCRFVTSCRTAFYKDYFSRFTDVLLTEFTDDQIQNLVRNWFRSDRDREVGTADRLWNELKDPRNEATLELARTPLLAAFLCLVYDDRQKFPTNRAELYEDALRILLEKWAASNRVHREPVFQGLSTKRERLMLEQIAGPAYEREQYFFTAQELATSIEAFLESDAGGPDKVDGRQVLEEIEKKQGLLLQRAHDKYSFSHLTLHEYLAACHYYKAGRSRAVVNATLTEDRWREVHLLLAGLHEPDADSFLLELAETTASQLAVGRLKELVARVEQAARKGQHALEAVTGRAATLCFAIALSLARSLTQVLDDNRTGEQPQDRDLVLTRALVRAHELGRTLEFDLDLARNLVHALSLSRILNLGRDVDFERAVHFALGIVIDLGELLIRKEFINKEISESISIYHKLLRRHTRGTRTFRREPKDMQRLLRGMQERMKTPSSGREISMSDAKRCEAFLASTHRVIECREAAERVTQDGWNRVCERLIALPKVMDATP